MLQSTEKPDLLVPLKGGLTEGKAFLCEHLCEKVKTCLERGDEHSSALIYIYVIQFTSPDEPSPCPAMCSPHNKSYITTGNAAVPPLVRLSHIPT